MKVPYDYANLPRSEKDKFVTAFLDQILGPDPGPDGDQPTPSSTGASLS